MHSFSLTSLSDIGRFMSLNKRIGFIGGGQMCSALAGGMIKADIVQPKDVIISDSYQPQLDKLKEKFGVNTTTDNVEVVKSADIIILAVKPNVVPAVLAEISSVYTTEKLLISICAGVSLDTLQKSLGHDTPRIARVMPNTPALYGVGASGFCLCPHAHKDDSATVEKLMSSVAEKDLHGVTAASGSSPALVYMFIESIADGSVAAGLPRPLAMKLAVQSVLGSAVMVKESGIHPGQLKDNVASAGGTTIAAIHALERGGFRGTVMDAIMACYERSKEMSLPSKL